MNFVSQVNFSINNSPFAADFTTKISPLAENNIASATLAGQRRGRQFRSQCWQQSNTGVSGQPIDPGWQIKRNNPPSLY